MTTADLDEQQLLIDGEWTPAADGGTFERANPLSGDAVTTAAAAGRGDVRPAVAAAQASMPSSAR